MSPDVPLASSLGRSYCVNANRRPGTRITGQSNFVTQGIKRTGFDLKRHEILGLPYLSTQYGWCTFNFVVVSGFETKIWAVAVHRSTQTIQYQPKSNFYSLLTHHLTCIRGVDLLSSWVQVFNHSFVCWKCIEALGVRRLFLTSDVGDRL